MRRKYRGWNMKKIFIGPCFYFLCAHIILRCYVPDLVFMQREMEELRQNPSSISTSSDDNAKRLKEEYLQKLNLLEAQVTKIGET